MFKNYAINLFLMHIHKKWLLLQSFRIKRILTLQIDAPFYITSYKSSFNITHYKKVRTSQVLPTNKKLNTNFNVFFSLFL